MRFLIHQTTTHLTALFLPAHVQGSLKQFHGAMHLYSSDICATHNTDGSFYYQLFEKIRTEDDPDLLFMKISHAQENTQHPRQRYLGPKGVEIELFFTPHYESDARQLLDDVLAKMPLQEAGEQQEVPVRDYSAVILWYKARCEELTGMEKLINDALKDTKFKDREKSD